MTETSSRGIKWADGWYVLIAVLALIACSCSRPSQPERRETSAAPPRFCITRLDGGLLTTYDPGVKGLTKPVLGTSIRRSFVILNDATCPTQISAFGLRTWDELSLRPCTPAKQLANPMDFDCAKLLYILNWSLKARSSVAVWGVHNSVFDAMNRFLWDNKAGNEGRENDGVEPGVEHKTDRVSWWNSTETPDLGKWVTSVLFVGAARTKDGAVWLCDKEALKAQIRALSFEIPSELK